MMERSFFGKDKAVLTAMVQADRPERIKVLMERSVQEGAEAFGMQFEQMKTAFRTKEVYRDLFAYAADRPVYVTNYRLAENAEKTDEMLAEELVELAACGADLCDVMGDYYDRQEGELSVCPEAVEKQKHLIERLHQNGASVLMSSHVFQYTKAERVLEIALEHQKRGADISKIVTGAETMAEQLENLKMIDMLKRHLDIPFLFLCVGECQILRRIGGELGCCMYLGVPEHDAFATAAQPLLSDLTAIRNHM